MNWEMITDNGVSRWTNSEATIIILGRSGYGLGMVTVYGSAKKCKKGENHVFKYARGG